MKLLDWVPMMIAAGILPQTVTAECVKSDVANLRHAPSIRAKKSWQVYKYMPFRVIGRRQAWMKVVDLDGDRHWIHSKLITRAYHCGVIKTSSANLRSGPGHRYSILDTVKKNVAFRILHIKGNWAEVKSDFGAKFWVSRRLLWIQ